MTGVSFHIELYQAVVSAFALFAYGGVILLARSTVKFTKTLYIGFIIWAIIHLVGIGVYIDGVPMYSRIILTLSDTLPILRYDQLVHMFGFAMATLLIYELTGKNLKKGNTSVLFLVVLAGLGIGAVNEIVEFMVSVNVENSNVGGYQNTSLDLIADLIGALLILPLIYKRHMQK